MIYLALTARVSFGQLQRDVPCPQQGAAGSAVTGFQRVDYKAKTKAAWWVPTQCVRRESSGRLPRPVIVQSQYQLSVLKRGREKIPCNPLKQLKG